MRFGEAVQISGPLRLVWNRISFSRLTLIYFFFSISHFIIQLSFQIKAFTINADAAQFLTSIVDEAHTTNSSLPFLSGSTLRMCSWVPSSLNVDIASCPVVWSSNDTSSPNINYDYSGNKPDNTALYPVPPTRVPTVSSYSSSRVSSLSVPTSSTLSSFSQSSSLSSQPNLATIAAGTTVLPRPTTFTIVRIRPTPAITDNGVINEDAETDQEAADDPFRFRRRDVQIIPSRHGDSVKVTLVGLEGQGQETFLDHSCLWSLNWPVSVLGNTKREDMVFIAFQVWVLGMSIVALLNESIPHILASLVTHMMATAWAAFQIVHTSHFRTDFNRVITHGACKNVALLPNYWEARAQAEIPSLALNVIALLVSCFLTWKLIKLFGWQTFKRVGASLTINRIYKLVLFLSITIQLSLFFMIVTVSLWVDQLINNLIGDLTSFQKLYEVTSFITLALLIPWLMTGWFAVRRELRWPMAIFLFLSILYLGGWGVMFFSTTFRWTFTTWIFFSIMASASMVLTLLSVVLGVICRMNFGKGLARYLNAHQLLEDEGDFNTGNENSDVEKVAFPSSEKPLPTYASFEEPDNGFTPSSYSGSTLGPRFSNKFAEPFESAIPALSYPAPAQRNVNDVQVHRSASYGSTRSYESDTSRLSHTRSDSSHSHGTHKRWVIE